MYRSSHAAGQDGVEAHEFKVAVDPLLVGVWMRMQYIYVQYICMRSRSMYMYKLKTARARCTFVPCMRTYRLLWCQAGIRSVPRPAVLAPSIASSLEPPLPPASISVWSLGSGQSLTRGQWPWVQPISLRARRMRMRRELRARGSPGERII